MPPVWRSQIEAHEIHRSKGVKGLSSNSGEGLNVCKCVVPPRHEGILNSRQAASPLVRLVEEQDRWEVPGHPQCVLPHNWVGTLQNRTITCMVLKAKANDMRKNLSLSCDEFPGP
ncbi:cullin-4A [Trichonephila clavipes]|nr:cullin-4A [Trichonephila clavipes]